LALSSSDIHAFFSEISSGDSQMSSNTSKLTGAAEDMNKKMHIVASTIEEMAEIAGAIAQVNEIVTSIAAAVEEQSATTAEIASDVARRQFVRFNEQRAKLFDGLDELYASGVNCNLCPCLSHGIEIFCFSSGNVDEIFVFLCTFV